MEPKTPKKAKDIKKVDTDTAKRLVEEMKASARADLNQNEETIMKEFKLVVA